MPSIHADRHALRYGKHSSFGLATFDRQRHLLQRPVKRAIKRAIEAGDLTSHAETPDRARDIAEAVDLYGRLAAITRKAGAR